MHKTPRNNLYGDIRLDFDQVPHQNGNWTNICLLYRQLVQCLPPTCPSSTTANWTHIRPHVGLTGPNRSPRPVTGPVSVPNQDVDRPGDD